MRKAPPPLIALITDFGSKDWYTGSMVGTIYKHCPEARVETITHNIPPGDIRSASYVLASCIDDFPASTIFICVVDPGVGTDRKAMMGRIGNQTVICPNNGLISDCIHHDPQSIGKFYEVLPENSPSDFISATFHGRDIFAPVAGKVAAGKMKIEELGPLMTDILQFEIPKPEIHKGAISGSVRYIDVFGNAITNISGAELSLFSIRATAYLTIMDIRIPLRTTFGESQPGQPLTYIGSNGFLEIAVNGGNGATQLGIKTGESLKFFPDGKEPLLPPKPPVRLNPTES